jgi:hypothetical protein
MRPKIIKIIWNDWPALFGAILIPVIWIVDLAWPYIRPSDSNDGERILFVAVPVSIVALALLVWRVVRVYRLFQQGEIVVATITQIRMVRDRGRVEFSYEVEGVRHTSWMPVHRTKSVLVLHEGQRVEVLVNRLSPNTAIIRQLFL